MIPASLTSDPLARVAVFATNVNQSEYHCWVVQLAAVQLEELDRRFGQDVVFCEADQVFIRDVTHVFTKFRPFEVAYTLDHINGVINSGLMMAGQVSNMTLQWWQT